MARPLRLEISGAICHVFACGNRCEAINSDDAYGEGLGCLDGGGRRLREVRKVQRRPFAIAPAAYDRRWPDRREAMAGPTAQVHTRCARSRTTAASTI